MIDRTAATAKLTTLTITERERFVLECALECALDHRHDLGGYLEEDETVPTVDELRYIQEKIEEA